jgi:cysteinyl-tRNA synthetase
VRLVENITDINDKIYTAAQGRGVRSNELAAEMARAFIADTDRLGLGRPDEEPLATETIPEIVALIEELVAAGHAYEAGGDVYFAVRTFDRYGELSGQRPDDVESGARVEPGEHKRDPVDFALWKATKDARTTRTPPGRHRGAPAGLPGTSSARRWPRSCSAASSRCTAAGAT